MNQYIIIMYVIGYNKFYYIIHNIKMDTNNKAFVFRLEKWDIYDK